MDPDEEFQELLTPAEKRRLSKQAKAEEMAAWCLLTRQSPETYMSLTRLERAAFVRIASRRR